MTNSMRWGLTSLTALGLVVAGVAFVGCSSSSSTPAADTGTGDDTGTPTDSATDGATDSASATDSATDAVDAAVVADRKITIIHASPDAGNQIFCFGAAAGSTPANYTLAQALFVGVPSASDPTNGGKYTGFPYGAVIPMTFPNAQISAGELKSLEGFKIVAFPIGSTNPLATASKTDVTAQTQACSTAFASIKADPTKYILIPPGTVLAGTSTLMYAAGCAVAADVTDPTKPQCSGKGLTLGYKTLDLSAATFPSDAGTNPKTTFHFFNASPFGVAGTPPTFQGVDVLLMPMSKAVAGGDAGADGGDAGGAPSQPTGNPIPVAVNVSFGDVVGAKLPAADAGTSANPGMGVQLPAGTDALSSYWVILPHGATFCQPGATCPAIWLPVGSNDASKPGWLDSYTALAAAGGLPTPGFVDGSHQLVVLSGAPPSDPTTPTMFSLNMGWGNVGAP